MAGENAGVPLLAARHGEARQRCFPAACSLTGKSPRNDAVFASIAVALAHSLDERPGTAGCRTHLGGFIAMNATRSGRALARASLLAIAAPLVWLLASPACADEGLAPAAPPSESRAADVSASGKVDAEKLFGAIVKVSARAVPDARSSESLGSEREGSGVVIGDNGLVLTIGYLIVEADEVKITDAKGRTLPANVVGYDHASGFGLVRAAVPLDAQPVQLGDSGKTEERDPVMIASAGGDGAAFAWIVSKRPFTGNWEYQLDYALFTSPPASNWSGAALIDREGKLVGIGSLIVREATTEDPKVPGNVFVPIDLLKPILNDLVKQGRRSGPARPWLGVSADEIQGHLLVTRVSPDGPADRAGLSVGDIILGVGSDAVRTQSQLYERVWNRRRAGDDVPLKVLQGVDVKDIRVHSIDRVDYFRPRSSI
jgi:serine protease Do